MSLHQFFFRVCCAFLLFPFGAQARWATFNDANLEIEFYHKQVRVEADGSSIQIVEVQAKILKEQGRSAFANFLSYNANSSVMRVLEAKTIVGDKEYPLDNTLIEDKPLASDGKGFDQINQIVLSYPHAQIHSKLYLKYKLHTTKPSIPDHYSEDFVWGHLSSLWQKSKLSIDSAIKLHIQVNDPDNVLAVQQQQKGNRYHTTVELTNPIMKQINNEHHAILENKHLPWLGVSSIEHWDTFADLLKISYLNTLRQPLPKLYQAIVDHAATLKTAEEKINYIVAELAEKIQYMGDWRTNQGRVSPRDLQQTVDKQLGDCKDYATATVAILSKLGIQANIALVDRSYHHNPTPHNLPTGSHTNHAIVKVTLPNRVIWLDPTNLVSMTNGIFPDISDRWAIVLDETPARQHIPKNKPADMAYDVFQELELTDSITNHAKGEIKLLGVAASELTASKLLASEESINRFIMSFVVDNSRLIKKHVHHNSDLSSRVVADLAFEFDYIKRSQEFRTNAGYAIPLSNQYLRTITAEIDRASSLFIGPRRSFTNTQRFTKIRPVSNKPMSCAISSPWFNASRKVDFKSDSVKVVDSIEIKEIWIDNTALKTDQFKSLQREIDACFNNGMAIVFERDVA